MYEKMKLLQGIHLKTVLLHVIANCEHLLFDLVFR